MKIEDDVLKELKDMKNKLDFKSLSHTVGYLIDAEQSLRQKLTNERKEKIKAWAELETLTREQKKQKVFNQAKH